MSEPKYFVQEQYVLAAKRRLLSDAKLKRTLIHCFQELIKKGIALAAAHRIVSKAVQFRRKHVGVLPKAIKYVSKLNINDQCDFGEDLHSARSEPFFFESAYRYCHRSTLLIVDSRGQCRTIEADACNDQVWKCSSMCKPLTNNEVDSILEFYSDFKNPMHELLATLTNCDDCPNFKYDIVVHDTDESSEDHMSRKGYGMLCYLEESNCNSKVRILRSASTHHPTLRSFLHALYNARNSCLQIQELDEALCKGDVGVIMKLLGITWDNIFSGIKNNVTEGSDFEKPDLELRWRLRNVKLFGDYQNAVDDYPNKVCCSCHQLYQRKSVSVVWPLLKQYMQKKDAEAAAVTHFMCNYCKTWIKNNKLPARCVLNGLHVSNVPPELSKLDFLSKRFVPLAKAYQTVIKLGTYTAKVPAYNSLKASKGTMFFLPLPLDKTLQTLEQVEENEALAEPELYIMVNARPTKTKMVWHTLVDVNQVLFQITILWFYS